MTHLAVPAVSAARSVRRDPDVVTRGDTVDMWKYQPASADEVDDDTSAEGQAARSDRAKQRWYEQLNAYGEEGWELVTEHISESTNQTTYWGTLKQRHDTDD